MFADPPETPPRVPPSLRGAVRRLRSACPLCSGLSSYPLVLSSYTYPCRPSGGSAAAVCCCSFTSRPCSGRRYRAMPAPSFAALKLLRHRSSPAREQLGRGRRRCRRDGWREAAIPSLSSPTSKRRSWGRRPSRRANELSVPGRIAIAVVPAATSLAGSSGSYGGAMAANARSFLPMAGDAPSVRSSSTTTWRPTPKEGQPPWRTSLCAAGGTTNTRPSWCSDLTPQRVRRRRTCGPIRAAPATCGPRFARLRPAFEISGNFVLESPIHPRSRAALNLPGPGGDSQIITMVVRDPPETLLARAPSLRDAASLCGRFALCPLPSALCPLSFASSSSVTSASVASLSLVGPRSP